MAPGGASVREELGLRFGTGLVWLLTGYHAEIEQSSSELYYGSEVSSTMALK